MDHAIGKTDDVRTNSGIPWVFREELPWSRRQLEEEVLTILRESQHPEIPVSRFHFEGILMEDLARLRDVLLKKRLPNNPVRRPKVPTTKAASLAQKYRKDMVSYIEGKTGFRFRSLAVVKTALLESVANRADRINRIIAKAGPDTAAVPVMETAVQ